MSKSATNWSEKEDAFTQEFWDQHQSQHWFPEEYPIASDALDWQGFSEIERLAYMRASAGLNAMDTLQGEVGMPAIHRLVEGHQRKATIAAFANMENIHARSYSAANRALLTASEERAIFEWIEGQPQLQHKIAIIREVYDHGSLIQIMAASCLLETALFYSGFFYPLYLAGQGRMVNMGEVFTAISLDEAVHGTYIGLLFQGQIEGLGSESEKSALLEWFKSLAMDLYRNECDYTDALYAEIGLASAVKAFVRFNFNVCCDNLGLERLFPDEEVNAVVMNGIRGQGSTHDFFSVRGGSYQVIQVQPLTDAMIDQVWNG